MDDHDPCADGDRYFIIRACVVLQIDCASGPSVCGPADDDGFTAKGKSVVIVTDLSTVRRIHVCHGETFPFSFFVILLRFYAVLT